MTPFLLNKIEKNKQYLTSYEDIKNYLTIINREITIDTITPAVAESINQIIRYWNLIDENNNTTISNRKPINIYINSIGGSLDAAISIMNTIQISKTPIYTYNIGTVYAESFLIYLAGHKRMSYVNSLFMYRDNLFISNENNIENIESNFYNKINALDKLHQDIKMFILDKTTITESQYDKHKKNEWWFTANDAWKNHICDSIEGNYYQYLNKQG